MKLLTDGLPFTIYKFLFVRMQFKKDFRAQQIGKYKVYWPPLVPTFFEASLYVMNWHSSLLSAWYGEWKVGKLIVHLWVCQWQPTETNFGTQYAFSLMFCASWTYLLNGMDRHSLGQIWRRSVTLRIALPRKPYHPLMVYTTVMVISNQFENK